MLGLVAGVVLVLSSSHVQEAVHHGHTLVEALGRQLGQVTPGGSSVTRVPPQHLSPEVKGQRGVTSLELLLANRDTQSTDLAAESSLSE